MNMSAQFFKSLSTHRRKALRLLSIFAMSLAVTNSYAMQWCGNLPRDSAAYFACESLNQQERFQNEQRREYQEQKARQEQADLNRRVEEFLREAEMRREKEKDSSVKELSKMIDDRKQQYRSVIIDSRYVVTNDEVRDKNTNLVWKRCLVGTKWNGADCAGEVKYLTEPDALELAQAETTADGVAWKVPNKDELYSLAPIRNNKGVAEAVFGKSWTLDHLFVDADGRSFGQSFSYINLLTGSSDTTFGDNGAALRLLRTHN